VTPKSDPKAPKKFTDCAKLYSECIAPNEQSVAVHKKNKLKLKNQTTTPTYAEETTNEIDLVTKYVKERKV
jgi:hypothetical protein